jgi:glycosyltransferase involved in cell wall biosynthesis
MVTQPQVLGQLARLRSPRAPLLGLSLVAPVYEEEENLRPLYESVLKAMAGRDDWELILVDDGSLDRSPELIRELCAEDPRVVGIYFERNCGQTAAMGAGIQLAHGELIATLDSDLQNDPGDIPRLIEVLGDHDAVVGYRIKRNDNWLRRISSRIANGIRNRLSQDQIRDTGCSLKVFRAEAIQVIPLFEGMHRFYPTLLRYHGFRVLEHPVSHRPRVTGRSKYGVLNRAWRAFKDLLVVRWMHGRLIRIPLGGITRRNG